MHGEQPNAGQSLLRDTDITALCLTCHATDFGSVMGTVPLSPPPERGAGNFVFLFEDNINDAPDGALSPIPGHAAGHSVVSTGWGLEPDPLNPTAPGSGYPSDQLTCTSCHDPHGNQAFRILRGNQVENRTGFLFRFPAPKGDGLEVSGGGVETQTSHTAYQSGWSNWCANCHGLYHHGGQASGFEHPVRHGIDRKMRESYNAYNGPADPTGGSFATAYIAEVPFEDDAMTTSTTSGPETASRINCMTCHRAHATSAPDALRWDPNVATLGLDGLASGSYPIPNPYGDPNQRSLCVKCHYKESTEHGQGQACMDCHRNLHD